MSSSSDLESPLNIDSHESFDTHFSLQPIDAILASTSLTTTQSLPPTSKPNCSPLQRTSTTTPNSSFATPTSTPSTSITPTIIGRSISTHYVKDLMELLQGSKFRKLELGAKFEYLVTVEPQAFVAVCTIFKNATGETVWVTPVRKGGVWPNKKRAKEEAARLAVEWLKLEENLGARVVEETKKATAAAAAGGGVGGVNWVGELLEWAQKRAIVPIYTTYTLPPPQPWQPPKGTPSFSCTVEIKLTELQRYLPDLATAPVFGDASLPFSSKKTAKFAAAKAAMLWIEKNGIKSIPNEKQAAETGPETSGPHPLAGKAITISRNWKARRMVAEIAKELKYHVEYEVVPVGDGAVAIYTATAIVTRRWGEKRMAKVKGSGEGVLGRDNAKEQVAKMVTRWFEKMELKRLGVGVILKEEEE